MKNSSGFSSQWEEVYSRGEQITLWPWSDLVSLVIRYCPKIIELNSLKVLELGCGAGANIPFFLSLGSEYYSIEGSKSIVKGLHERFPELSKNIVLGDFTKKEFFIHSSFFDLVVDRAALTHNDQSSIENSITQIKKTLKPGGYFIGIDWFSKNHSEATLGIQGKDPHTRTEIIHGNFASIGNVHFSDEKHLCYLFKDFEILLLQEKTYKTYCPESDNQFSSWNIVVRRNI